MQILKQIFSVTNEKKNKGKTIHKIVTVLGVKFKIKKKLTKIETLIAEVSQIKEDLYKLSDISSKNFAVAELHKKTFLKYKNSNKGKDVVLCGAGPSLNYYEPINEQCKHLALNRAILKENIQFDYIFAQDWKGIFNIIDDIKNYKGRNCIKFIGHQDGCLNEQIPESKILEFDCERFYTDIYKYRLSNKFQFAYDITTQPLGNFGTIAFPAMQFLLWTNPRRIYIVGCDSAPVGHFSGEELPSNKRALGDETYPRIIRQWKMFKDFAQLYYPNVEIISVNPIGLKGIFSDTYTQDFLKDYPQ